MRLAQLQLLLSIGQRLIPQVHRQGTSIAARSTAAPSTVEKSSDSRIITVEAVRKVAGFGSPTVSATHFN